MKRIYLPFFLLAVLICACGEDRPRTNPFDPETELDFSEWAPSNLQVQVISDSEIKLTWTQEDERISGFRIGRKAGTGSFSEIDTVDADVTEYMDTGLHFGTDYIYRVKAFTEENESWYAISDTTGTIFPSPSNLTATPVSDSEIQLAWSDNCSFEAGFKLERSGGGSFIQIGEVDTNVTVYTDTGLTVGTDYAYRIKAFTDENESNYALSSATNTSFPSPTNLTATAIDDQSLQLTWSHNCSFEDGYRLERSEDTVTFTQIAELGENITEYTDTGLTLGSDYIYRVKAFTEINESDYSTSGTVSIIFPSPTDLVGTPIDDQSIRLTWSHNCNFEDGYKLERSEDGVTFTQIAELSENVSEYTDTGLALGTDYTYRVKAFTAANESDYAMSNTTTMSFPPPTNLSATQLNDTNIQLAWSDNCSFEDGYRLERSSGGYFTQIAELGENSTEYTDTGLVLGTDYTYRVKAFTAANESDYATSNTTTMSFPPPTNLSATQLNDTNIRLAWSDNCVFEDGYRLERSADGGSFTQIAESGENSTEYTDTGLVLGTDYTYRVKAYTYENESLYSNSVLVNFSYGGPTWYVSISGSDDNVGSEESPFSSVSQGIDASSEGDTVLILPGSYDVTQTLIISNITLTSRFIYNNDHSMIASTVLNGTVNNYIFQLSGDGANLIGLTINNSVGSGIRITESPLIQFCILNDFDQTYPHAAIVVDGGDPSISNCNLSNAYFGISVHDYGAQPFINNCIMYNNMNGIRNWTYSSGSYQTIVLNYSLFYSNDYGDVYDDGTGAASMVSFLNCLFENPDFNDPTNNDFTLQSTSPCIDAGNPDLDGDGSSYNTDIDDQDPDGTRMDMGAFYYHQ
jgi:hypothetical protein